MISNKPSQKRLFIGSLPYSFTEGELLALFIPFGKIVAVKIIKNQWGKSRGMGYVEYEQLDDAVIAKQKMHNHSLGERTIIVDYAQPDPFKTPEGQKRHLEAQSGRKHPKRNPNIDEPRSFGPKPKPKSRRTNLDSPASSFKSKDPKHVRQSLFDSRNYGSRVGAKFAKRNKKKIK